MSLDITNNTLVRVIVRRGSDADRLQCTLAAGELGYTLDKKRLFIGNGLSGTEVVAGNKFLGYTQNISALANDALGGDTCYDEISQALLVWTIPSGASDYTWVNISPGTSVNLENSLSGLRIKTTFAGTGFDIVYGAGSIELDASYWTLSSTGYGGAGTFVVGAASALAIDFSDSRAIVQGPLTVTDGTDRIILSANPASNNTAIFMSGSGTITAGASALTINSNVTVTGTLSAPSLVWSNATTISGTSSFIINLTNDLTNGLTGLRIFDDGITATHKTHLLDVQHGLLYASVSSTNGSDRVRFVGVNTVLPLSTTSAIFGVSGQSEFRGNVTIIGDLSATGDITAYYASDAMLKDNIIGIDNALSKVLALRGVEFDWSGTKAHQGHDVGVIAQDVEQQIPSAVALRHDGFKGVNYHKIIPLLIEAVRELNSKVK